MNYNQIYDEVNKGTKVYYKNNDYSVILNSEGDLLIKNKYFPYTQNYHKSFYTDNAEHFYISGIRKPPPFYKSFINPYEFTFPIYRVTNYEINKPSINPLPSWYISFKRKRQTANILFVIHHLALITLIFISYKYFALLIKNVL